MDHEKKNERKRKRFAVRLKSSRGISCTDTPGINILLCNVGQATGFGKTDIENIITRTGLDIQVPKYISEKGETHSYLSFSKSDQASLFFKYFNGAIDFERKVPIYMNFVETVPDTEIICEHRTPEGLSLLSEFISEAEEKLFIDLFDRPESESNETSNLKNRQVSHYGYEFKYGSNDVDLSSPLDEKIPEQCEVLWERLRRNGFEIEQPDQLTVNKYVPGQGIPSHVDKHSPFEGTILSLSLGSSVVMDWKHHSGKYVPVEVPARAMLVMQGEARYDWQHGIQPRTWDPIIETRLIDKLGISKEVRVVTNDIVPRGTRISLTFRKTRVGPCRCKYKTLCDSVEKISPDNIEDDLASNIEELHVHQVYDQIAQHFSATRQSAWPAVARFVQRASTAAVLLDLGAGNGKNLLHRSDLVQLAGERSAGLARECASRCVGGAADTLQLDMLWSPLRDACADLVICIAVVHHFSNKARRIQAIKTIARLLKSGGEALITVWAKDQSKSNYLAKEIESNVEQHVNVAGLSLPVHENRTQFRHKDLLVPWKLRKMNNNKLESSPNSTLLRYYHVFEEGELADLCREVDGLVVEETFYEEGNWCVICKKI